jgi:hypothetical protein
MSVRPEQNCQGDRCQCADQNRLPDAFASERSLTKGPTEIPALCNQTAGPHELSPTSPNWPLLAAVALVLALFVAWPKPMMIATFVVAIAAIAALCLVVDRVHPPSGGDRKPRNKKRPPR